MRDRFVLILQSSAEVKHCLFSFHQPTRSHVKPIYLAGESFFSPSCAVVREVHGSTEMFVFVLLAEFSACGRSQFLGAPRECISTDGGFNWSVGFQNQGYMLLLPPILICLFASLFVCLCVVFQQDNDRVWRVELQLCCHVTSDKMILGRCCFYVATDKGHNFLQV